MVPASEMVWVLQQRHTSTICAQSPSLAQLDVGHYHTHYQANEAHSIHVVIGIAGSNQVQGQQRRDEPVRENTHLVLDTLASRLRSYHSIVRS